MPGVRMFSDEEDLLNQSVTILSLLDQQEADRRRYELRGRQRTSAFVGGVVVTVFFGVAAWLLVSYDVAQVADRALRMVGL